MVAFSRKNSFATTVRFFEEYGLIYTFRSNEKLKASRIILKNFTIIAKLLLS